MPPSPFWPCGWSGAWLVAAMRGSSTGYRPRRRLRLVLTGQEPRYLGHNPAGAAMMLLLMAVVAGLGLTGWLMTTDAFWGVRWIKNLHEALGEALPWMIGIYIIAALWESWRHREILVLSMVTGRKRPLTPDAAGAD